MMMISRLKSNFPQFKRSLAKYLHEHPPDPSSSPIFILPHPFVPTHTSPALPAALNSPIIRLYLHARASLGHTAG